jgi:hypothetical protein
MEFSTEYVIVQEYHIINNNIILSQILFQRSAFRRSTSRYTVPVGGPCKAGPLGAAHGSIACVARNVLVRLE